MIVLLYGRNGWFGPLLEAANIKIFLPCLQWYWRVLYHLAFVAREVIPVLEEAGSDRKKLLKLWVQNDWQIFWRVPYLILVGVCFMASF